MIPALLGLTARVNTLLTRLSNSTEPLNDARVLKLDNLDANLDTIASGSGIVNNTTWNSMRANRLNAAVSSRLGGINQIIHLYGLVTFSSARSAQTDVYHMAADVSRTILINRGIRSNGGACAAGINHRFVITDDYYVNIYMSTVDGSIVSGSWYAYFTLVEFKA